MAGGLASLKKVRIPKVPGLLQGSHPIVRNEAMAVALGKALFWDVTLGNDGMACASCHFEAGADPRLTNQLGRPQAVEQLLRDSSFGPMASGRKGTVNQRPLPEDFPYTQFEDPLDNLSPLKFQTDNVMGSAGTFHRQFLGPGDGFLVDDCRPDFKTEFQFGGRLSRQVGYRNTPTVINAVFNYRLFWDGRANHFFNGESPWGPKDPSAGVWVADGRGGLIKRRILLDNAALASQAVAPILNAEEMACEGRTLADVARKVLPRRALERQTVAADDSVLQALRAVDGQGLSLSYADLIKAAFDERYWGVDAQGLPGGQSQMAANFAFFFGLAVQLYETTLVSDQSPFDSPPDATGYPRDLNPAQRRGQALFVAKLCHTCHAGPTFSLAAHPKVSSPDLNPNRPKFVDRMVINGVVPGLPAKESVTFTLFDRGFANTSVVPAEFDEGLGGADPFGHPYAFSGQYLEVLLGREAAMADPIPVYACDFLNPFTQDYRPEELVDDPNVKAPSRCRKTRGMAKVPRPAVLEAEREKPGAGRALTMVRGAFKIPTLRNIELTGPYMHTGGMKSLSEVLDFYNRAGNVSNESHFATLVVTLGLSPGDRADLIEFLKSLTDERVRSEQPPFDHPSLEVPEGSDEVGSDWPLLAKDRIRHVPAVGRTGRPQALGPLKPFDLRLEEAQNQRLSGE